MTMHDKNLSRRTMLKGASALVIGLYLPAAARAQSGAAAGVRARRRCRRGHVRAQCFHSRRRRRRRDGAEQAYRIRAGAVHRPRHTRRRGDGRRLVEDARRARAVGSESLQQPRVRPGPGHRRLDRHRQFLRADAQGRRDRARVACACGERSLERAGGRDHHRERRVETRRLEPPERFWRVRGSGREIAGAGECAAEKSGGLQIDRPGRRRKKDRHAGQGQRQGAIHHRYPRARHAHRRGDASAALWRQARKRRRCRGAEDSGRGRCESNPVRRRGLCARHVAGDQGPRGVARHLG